MFITPHKDTPIHTQYSHSGKSLREEINYKLKSQHKQQQNTPQQHNTQDLTQHDEEYRLLQSIKQLECKENKGYFKFDGWRLLNQQLFANVKDKEVLQLWKILRIINYGEVTLPTGLIYQVCQLFIVAPLPQNQHKYLSLKQILNNFLSVNQTSDSVNNFRQLSNYTPLETIQTIYKQNINKPKTKSNQSKSLASSDVYNRMHRQARNRDIKLNKMQYESLVKQTKQCKFNPTIHRYKSNSQIQKCQRICYHKQDYLHSFIEECNAQMIPLFKAKQVDPKIYHCSLEEIPGTTEHIHRSKHCEAERLRIQRYLSKPSIKMR